MPGKIHTEYKRPPNAGPVLIPRPTNVSKIPLNQINTILLQFKFKFYFISEVMYGLIHKLSF